MEYTYTGSSCQVHGGHNARNVRNRSRSSPSRRPAACCNANREVISIATVPTPRRLFAQYGFVLAAAAAFALPFGAETPLLAELGWIAGAALLFVPAARDRLRRRTERQVLARRLELLQRDAGAGVVLIDGKGRFVDVNQHFLAMTGYSRDEALRLGLSDWRPAYLDAGRPSLVERVVMEGSAVLRTSACTRDGRMQPVEISASLVEAGTERLIQAVVQDVSTRDAAEARVLELSRLYAVMSAANQAMMRANSIQEVFDAVCRACVEYGQLRMAWVGLVDASGKRLLPHASFGEGLGYLEALAIPLDGVSPLSRGPIALAFREQQDYVCNDFTEDPVAAPWHQRAAFYGFRASIAVPLKRGGQCVGTLAAYAADRDRFDDDVVALMRDLGEGISFAMDNFDRSERRLRAEAALRLSKTRLLEAQAIGNIGDWFYDIGARDTNWSPQMYRLFERDTASPPPRLDEMSMYMDAATRALVREGLRRAIRTADRSEFEYCVRLPSGQRRHHATVIVPVRDAAGTVVGLQGTVQDVTARKEVEMHLRYKEMLLQEAQQVARMGSWEWLVDVGRASWSDTLYRIFGFEPGSPVPDSDTLLEMLTPESRDVVRAASEQSLKSGESYEVEVEVTCAGGVRKWLACRSAARRQGETIIGLYGTVQDITVRRRREAEREARERHMHELSRRLVAAQEDERRRLAAELHDRTSPNLAAVQVTLRSLNLAMPDAVRESLAEEFDDLRALLQDATTSIRDVCADLRPALLDYAGLVPALESHIHQFSRRTGVLVRLSHRGLDERLSAEIEALLFRIVQEALTNCAKHAQATKVSIALRKGKTHTVLTIRDDGLGFDVAAVGNAGRPGLGLLTMRERAEFAGGKMDIVSAPGRGTEIRVSV